MWEINTKSQLLTCLISFVFGCLVCAFYDIFRAYRKTNKCSFFGVFVSDVFFWVVTAFFTFLLLFARTGGSIRGYVLLSALSGFLACRFTISKILLKIYCFLFLIIKKIFNTAVRAETAFALLLCGFFDRISAFVKVNYLLIKKCLKNRYKVLYNKKNL